MKVELLTHVEVKDFLNAADGPEPSSGMAGYTWEFMARLRATLRMAFADDWLHINGLKAELAAEREKREKLEAAMRWRKEEEEKPFKERDFSANSVIVLVKIYSGLLTAAWYNYDTDEWHSIRDGLVQVLEWRYAEPVPPVQEALDAATD